jgi:hypothetical protein
MNEPKRRDHSRLIGLEWGDGNTLVRDASIWHDGDELVVHHRRGSEVAPLYLLDALHDLVDLRRRAELEGKDG